MVLLALALVFGGLLGFAAERFRVEQSAGRPDPAVTQTQCGQCNLLPPYAELSPKAKPSTSARQAAKAPSVWQTCWTWGQPWTPNTALNAKRVAVIREDECRLHQVHPGLPGRRHPRRRQAYAHRHRKRMRLRPVRRALPVDCIDMVTWNRISTWTWTPPEQPDCHDRRETRTLMTQLWNFAVAFIRPRTSTSPPLTPFNEQAFWATGSAPAAHRGACRSGRQRWRPGTQGQVVADVTSGMGVPVHALPRHH